MKPVGVDRRRMCALCRTKRPTLRFTAEERCALQHKRRRRPRSDHANPSTSATQRRTAFVLRLQENMRRMDWRARRRRRRRPNEIAQISDLNAVQIPSAGRDYYVGSLSTQNGGSCRCHHRRRPRPPRAGTTPGASVSRRFRPLHSHAEIHISPHTAFIRQVNGVDPAVTSVMAAAARHGSPAF
jgi:hypothetical protein